jgi:hemolysin D
VLTAPVAGVVQDLAVHTIGGVVTPAERLMTVVPDSRRLTVEARLANRDIGFVHPGQDVAVKVETFAFTRYGVIHGKVVDVSRDVAALPDRPDSDHPNTAAAATPSYVAQIALERADMVVDGETRALLPGMSVTAEIKTGRRTIIDYLLSPLARRESEAMHER